MEIVFVLRLRPPYLLIISNNRVCHVFNMESAKDGGGVPVLAFAELSAPGTPKEMAELCKKLSKRYFSSAARLVCICDCRFLSHVVLAVFIALFTLYTRSDSSSLPGRGNSRGCTLAQQASRFSRATTCCRTRARRACQVRGDGRGLGGRAHCRPGKNSRVGLGAFQWCAGLKTRLDTACLAWSLCDEAVFAVCICSWGEAGLTWDYMLYNIIFRDMNVSLQPHSSMDYQYSAYTGQQWLGLTAI